MAALICIPSHWRGDGFILFDRFCEIRTPQRVVSDLGTTGVRARRTGFRRFRRPYFIVAVALRFLASDRLSCTDGGSGG